LNSVKRIPCGELGRLSPRALFTLILSLDRRMGRPASKAIEKWIEHHWLDPRILPADAIIPLDDEGIEEIMARLITVWDEHYAQWFSEKPSAIKKRRRLS